MSSRSAVTCWRVPAGLQRQIGVGRLEEAGELRVALGRRVDAHRRDRVARRQRTLGSSSASWPIDYRTRGGFRMRFARALDDR